MKKTIALVMALMVMVANISFASVAVAGHSVNQKVAVKQESTKININTADAKTLSTLKGIGPKKAQAIVTYRQKNGGFKSVDDLAKVKGINTKLIARLLKNNPNRISAKVIKRR